MLPLATISNSIPRQMVNIEPPSKPVAAINPQMSDAMQATAKGAQANLAVTAQPLTAPTASPQNSRASMGFVDDLFARPEHLRAQLKTVFQPTGNSSVAASERKMMQMLDIQEQMHEAQFSMELASKVVEEATGGAKTLLQTQS